MADLLFQTSEEAFGEHLNEPSWPVSTTIADDTANRRHDWRNFRLTSAGATSSPVSVGTSGANDTTGNGTSGNPYLTIGKAIGDVGRRRGDRQDGTYSGTANWISTVQVTIPNGSAGAPRIRAENRFGVRITMSAAPSGTATARSISAPNGTYGWMDSSSSPPHCEHRRRQRQLPGRVRLGYALSSHAPDRQAQGCDSMAAPIRMETETSSGLPPLRQLALRLPRRHGRRLVASRINRAAPMRLHMPFGPRLEPHVVVQLLRLEHQQLRPVQDVLFANCYEIDSPHLPQKSGQSRKTLKWGSFCPTPRACATSSTSAAASSTAARRYGGIRYDNYGGAGAALGSIVDCFVVGFNNGSPGSAECFSKSSSNGHPRRTARAPSAWRLCRHRWLTLTSNLTSGITYPVLRQGGNGAEQKYAIGRLP